jgi:hypothetical protein
MDLEHFLKIVFRDASFLGDVQILSKCKSAMYSSEY